MRSRTEDEVHQNAPVAVARNRTPEAGGSRDSRRRTATKTRLVEAAEQLFQERGTINLSVEAICERAGFTRGAFYSNFANVDDVFLTGFIARSRALEVQLEAAIERGARSPARSSRLQDIVELVLAALPVDPSWSAIRAGLLSRTPKDEPITTALRDQADHFRVQLERLLAASMPLLGRELLADAATIAQAVLAADAGAQMQIALYDDADAVRTAAISGVILGLTRAGDADSGPSN